MTDDESIIFVRDGRPVRDATLGLLLADRGAAVASLAEIRDSLRDLEQIDRRSEALVRLRWQETSLWEVFSSKSVTWPAR